MSISNRIIVVVSTTLLLVGTFGCSGDDKIINATVSPQALVQVSLETMAGAAIVVDSMDISFSLGGENVFSFRVANADQGRTITVSESNNPDFSAAVIFLTDGNDDSADFGTLFPGGGGGMSSNAESVWFKGGITGTYDPDLAGTNVTHVLIHLDVVNIQSPGSDPNGNGIWTNYDFRIRMVIMGNP